MLTSNFILGTIVAEYGYCLSFLQTEIRKHWTEIVVRHSFIIMPIPDNHTAATKMPTDASRTACKPTTAVNAAGTFIKPSRSHTMERTKEC